MISRIIKLALNIYVSNPPMQVKKIVILSFDLPNILKMSVQYKLPNQTKIKMHILDSSILDWTLYYL